MQSVCLGDEAYSTSRHVPDAAAVIPAAQDTSAASALSQHLVGLPLEKEHHQHVQKHERKPHPFQIVPVHPLCAHRRSCK